MNSKILAKKIAKIALAKKAFDVVLLDISKITSMADYFVICSASSTIQVKAIVDHIVEEVKKIGEPVSQREGLSENSWVIIDLFDVVVHIFLEEKRMYYNLEKLWEDGKKEEIKEVAKRKKKKVATK